MFILNSSAEKAYTKDSSHLACRFGKPHNTKKCLLAACRQTSSIQLQPMQAAAAPIDAHRIKLESASDGSVVSGTQLPGDVSMSAAVGMTEHDIVKHQVQHWFCLDSLADVDLAIGPNSQVLAIAGDAVLKFQIVQRLFRFASFTSSAKVLHEESLKYITNRQLASVVAWQLDLHKLLRIYNFTPCNPSKAAVKRLGTAVEALLGVLALRQPSSTERVVGQIFCMIGEDVETRSSSPAISQIFRLKQ